MEPQQTSNPLGSLDCLIGNKSLCVLSLVFCSFSLKPHPSFFIFAESLSVSKSVKLLAGKMSGKGAKGLIMGKASASNKDKDKKKPISRSSRAGLQVLLLL